MERLEVMAKRLLDQVLSLGAIGFFYLYTRSRTTEMTATVPEPLNAAAEALRRLPGDGVLVLPFMYADYVAYASGKKVLWGGRCGDLRPLERVTRVLREPIAALLPSCSARYVRSTRPSPASRSWSCPAPPLRGGARASCCSWQPCSRRARCPPRAAVTTRAQALRNVSIDRQYILEGMKSIRAKLFQNGGSQAVRLPKECRFPAQREVLVRREGRRVLLEPADEWSDRFRNCLGAWAEDIPRPVPEELRDLRDPFA